MNPSVILADMCYESCREALTLTRAEFEAEARGSGVLGFMLGFSIAAIVVVIFLVARSRRLKK
jgi:hypothetical protein